MSSSCRMTVNNFKPKSRVVLEEISNKRMQQSLDIPRDEVVISDIPHVTTHETPIILVSHRNEKIIRAHDRFMLLRKAYEAIPKEPESNSESYKEAINHVDADVGSRL